MGGAEGRLMLRLVLGSMIVVAAFAESSALADDGSIRFRGGAGVTGGFLDIDNGFSGTVGPYAHVGVELNDRVGLYGVFEFDGVFVSNAGGVRVRHALGIDWTIADRISLGIGPSLAGLVAPAGVGVEVGPWLHVAGYPWMSREKANGQRKGLALAIDVTPAAVLTGPWQVPALKAHPGVHASLGVGYEVF
jgi:hypothetical protein